MVYDYKQMTSNIPQSSSLSCLDYVNGPCNISCGLKCSCQPSSISSMLNDHTYSILKRVCRKIIKDFNRNCCEEKYTVFDGGNSVNVRIHRSSTVSCEKSQTDRRQDQDELDLYGTHKRGISSAGRIDLACRGGDKSLNQSAGAIAVNLKKRRSRRDDKGADEGPTYGKRGVKQAKSKRKAGYNGVEEEEEEGRAKKGSQVTKKEVKGKGKGKAIVKENDGNEIDSNNKMKKATEQPGAGEYAESIKKAKKDKKRWSILEENRETESDKKSKKTKKKGADAENNGISVDNKKEDEGADSVKKVKKDQKKGAGEKNDDMVSDTKDKKGKKSVVPDNEEADSGRKGKKGKKSEVSGDEKAESGKKGKKEKKSFVPDDEEADADSRKKSKKDKKKGSDTDDDDQTSRKKGKKGKTSVVSDVNEEKDKKPKYESNEDNSSKKANNAKSKSVVPDGDEGASKKISKIDKKKTEKIQSDYVVSSKKESTTKKSSADLPIVKDLRAKVRKGVDVFPVKKSITIAGTRSKSKYKDDGEITLEMAVGRKSGSSKGKSRKVLVTRPTKSIRRISKVRVSTVGPRHKSDSLYRRFPLSRSDEARPSDYLRANMEQREVCEMMVTQTLATNQTCIVPAVPNMCQYQCCPRPITCIC